MSARELRARLALLLTELVDSYDDLMLPAIVSTTIEPGPPTGAYCCPCREDGPEDSPCGHAYIRVVRIHQTNNFPNQSLDPTHCRNIAALIEMGVMRCSPTQDSQGNPPSTQEWTDAAELTLIDAEVMYCVLVGHEPVWAQSPIVLDTGEPIDPSGGCVGFKWTFWLDVALDPSVGTSPSSPGSV